MRFTLQSLEPQDRWYGKSRLRLKSEPKHDIFIHAIFVMPFTYATLLLRSRINSSIWPTVNKKSDNKLISVRTVTSAAGAPYSNGLSILRFLCDSRAFW